MIVEIKAIYLSDFSDFYTFVPDDPEHFAVELRAMVGPVGEEWSESFRFTACSPGWIKEQIEIEGFMWRCDLLIVNDYNRLEIKRIADKAISRCMAPSWQEVAAQISRRTNWEFDTYT
ncbi:immunity 8 family protein [Deinococcus sp. HMF7604]|uniref:Imm8 family immunity protein n=1 Tax=Deinococcus betulae TaxID=2873312 RepID=UPI001CCC5EA6|nr:Imm8 family immunity protein [Deinococcus betulae]MBZ9751862.1 immunity 8 family protein [Deinococcus betulae]